MELVPREWRATTPEGTGVAGLGLLLAVAGLAVQDTFGIDRMLLALGLALIVAGATYAVVKGSDGVRLALAFVALVSAQLVFVGGVVRLIGVVGVGVVGVAAAYGRLR